MVRFRKWTGKESGPGWRLAGRPRRAVGCELFGRGDGREIASGKHILKKAQQLGVDQPI